MKFKFTKFVLQIEIVAHIHGMINLKIENKRMYLRKPLEEGFESKSIGCIVGRAVCEDIIKFQRMNMYSIFE